jgi:hypothetical protein
VTENSNLNTLDSKIKKTSEIALIYTIMGMLGLGFFILCPLGYIKGSKALRLIEENNIGEKYKDNAKFAKNASMVIFIVYSLLIALFFISG